MYSVYNEQKSNLAPTSYYVYLANCSASAVRAGFGVKVFKADWNTVIGSNILFSIGTTFSSVYAKFTGADANTIIDIEDTGANPTTTEFYVKTGRLYEIDQATYNLIDVDPEYTGERLATKYPYVDSVQFKRDVLLTQKGKNLIDGTLASVYVQSVNGAYNNAGAGEQSIVTRAISGAQYTLSCVGNDRNRWAFYNKIPTLNQLPLSFGEGYTTTVSPVGTMYLVWFIANTGTATPTAIQLELGSSATAFEPQTKSYAHIPQKIAQDESVWVFGNRAVYKKCWEKDVSL